MTMWVKLASILMFLGVSIGAFGSHAMRLKMTDYYMDVYKTGVLYHFIHALALFVVAWLVTQSNDPRIHLAGTFFVFGILLFSGSLYILAVTQIKWLGAITPVGGVSFLIGWLLIIISKVSS